MSTSSEFSDDYDSDGSSPTVQEESDQIDSNDENANSDKESHCSKVIVTPSGTKYWIPDVPEEIKPVVDTVFNSIDEARLMYEQYADKGGFIVRGGTSNKIKGNITSLKYYKCNRAGKPRKTVKVDTLQEGKEKIRRRHSNFFVTDCKACIKLNRVKGTSCFKVFDFIEKHNHRLGTEESRHLSRNRRQLTFEDQEFIQKVSTTNIGPVKAHRLQAHLKGGYDRVRGTEVDFKNFRRDINSFIGERDAQMLVDKLNGRKRHVPNFSVEYKCDNNELACLFWADETSKFNYSEFGHVLAFDATFRTNKYGMVFVPFTGIDNHNKCVIFAAGLLKNETVSSYVWLLEAFLKAHVKQPDLVLTDQDPSMKQAIPLVFTESQHMFCTWHIMSKVPVKVSGDNDVNKEIKRRLHKLVWNVYIDETEFERRWMEIISDFGLHENKWLDDMFQIRNTWIPSFFKHLPMCCLMKTTSRAESSNSMFRIFSHHGNTLVQFMLCFKAAMEKQRYKQHRLDHRDLATKPTMSTHLPIELHASKVYTRSTFVKVQNENFKSLYSCSQKSSTSEEGAKVCVIKHFNKMNKLVGEFKVVLKEVDQTVECSCNHFGRHGYLCRHVFCVFKSYNIEKIPEKYILRRWMTNILPPDLLHSRHRYGQPINETYRIGNEAISNYESCVSRLRSHPELLEEFVKKANELSSEFLSKLPADPPETNNKESVMERLLGVTAPKEVQIQVPTGIRNKGCGTGKRLKGPGEKAKEKKQKKDKKKEKQCQICFQTKHNSRTCPGRDSQGGVRLNVKKHEFFN